MFGLHLRSFSRQRLVQKGVAAATTLAPYEQVIDVRGGTYTITLPNVVEAAGRMYSFHCSEAVTEVSVAANDAYQSQFSTAVFKAQHDLLVLWSDGRFWYSLLDVTTP